MHDCPGPLCGNQVDYGMLACPGHWYQIPPPIRSAVWRAWDRGAGAGSDAHTAAINAAIAAMRPFKKDLP